MDVLLDTNILLRLVNTTDPQHGVASRAVRELDRRGDNLFITPQVLIEFRGAATRPTGVNGLGLSATGADQLVTGFEVEYPLLDDTRLIYPTWNGIVRTFGVIGKQVHDARLVAVCHVHTVTHLLTFNVRHFQTLSAAPPGIVVLDPATV